MADKISAVWNYRGLLLESLGISLFIALCAFIIGFFIGVVLAIIKIAPKNNVISKALNWFADIYIAVIRGTPTMVQLLIMYSSILVVFKYFETNLVVPIIAFGINSGAYMAEIIRAGINSVDKGQMEAGRSVGLSWTKTMGKIVIPQAVKTVIPTIFNEIIVLVKETSVISVIALRIGGVQKYDLLGLATDKIAVNNPSAYTAFLYSVALMYLTVVLLLTLVQKIIEKRLKKNER